MAHHYKNLEVWKKSLLLAVNICIELRDVKPHLWSLRDQISRAAISIPSNIAEGSERNTNKDFARFLSIAKGSSAELRTQLEILSRIDNNYIEPQQRYDIQLEEISGMLEGLIKRINSV